MSYFQLEGQKVPIESCLNFSQTYEAFGSTALLRMADGSAAKRNNWRKIKTKLSGSGWLPAGLDGIDYNGQLVLKCAAAKVITSTGTGIVMPAERRSDTGYAPLGYAIKASGERVDTSISISVNTATLGSVAGATHYQVEYFPEITVFAELTTSESSPSDATSSWSIEAEQV